MDFRKKRGNLPLLILRPPVISAAYAEPEPGSSHFM